MKKSGASQGQSASELISKRIAKRIANTSTLQRRSLRRWALSPRHKLPDSNTGRPRSRCHSAEPSPTGGRRQTML